MTRTASVLLMTSVLGFSPACDREEKTTRTGPEGSPAQPGEMPGTAAPKPKTDPLVTSPAKNDPHMVGSGQPGSNDKPSSTTVGLDEAPPAATPPSATTQP
ncbi:MAG: hypothetical protein IAG13_28640 [Deltaproteobacteria bacterium]|nr:hypothetical protein [Nannocystaceae bacterium]